MSLPCGVPPRLWDALRFLSLSIRSDINLTSNAIPPWAGLPYACRPSMLRFLFVKPCRRLTPQHGRARVFTSTDQKLISFRVLRSFMPRIGQSRLSGHATEHAHAHAARMSGTPAITPGMGQANANTPTITPTNTLTNTLPTVYVLVEILM